MLTLVCDLCDLCERSIKETGYVCDLVEAKLVVSDEGMPRMADRGRILSLSMCRNCAAQVQRRIHTLRARSGAARPS